MRTTLRSLASFLSICLSLSGCGDEEGKTTEDGGSTGGGGSPNDDDSEKASCSAFGSHLAAECGEDAAFQAQLCEDDRSLYEPIGCGAEYAQFVRCYSSANIPDCEEGYATGCPDPDIYLRCQSLFAARMLCSRLPSTDMDCGPDEFGFTCFGALPEGCSALTVEGGAAPIACCKSFAPSGSQPFED